MYVSVLHMGFVCGGMMARVSSVEAEDTCNWYLVSHDRWYVAQHTRHPVHCSTNSWYMAAHARGLVLCSTQTTASTLQYATVGASQYTRAGALWCTNNGLTAWRDRWCIPTHTRRPVRCGHDSSCFALHNGRYIAADGSWCNAVHHS